VRWETLTQQWLPGETLRKQVFSETAQGDLGWLCAPEKGWLMC